MQARLYTIQGLPAGQVSIMARPRGGDWLLDEIMAIRAADVAVLVSLLTPAEVMELDLREEAECCRSQEVLYLSFPILDRDTPPFTESTFTFLEQLHSQVLAGKHVAVHCRQGLGRAVLIAASVLVLAGFSPQQAFERLSAVRGYPVPETEEQRAWVVAFSQSQMKKP
ncbi:MAG: tyrosine protein phosphatase [Ktedonobacteraceae bacterium]